MKNREKEGFVDYYKEVKERNREKYYREKKEKMERIKERRRKEVEKRRNREKYEEEQEEGKTFSCPECKANSTYTRIKSGERVCRKCGNIWRREEEENGKT